MTPKTIERLTVGIATTILLLGIVFVANRAGAAEIQVYPYITATHGGQTFANDITVCLQVSGGDPACGTGVPSFFVPAGSEYQVITHAPTGYSAALGDTNCSGTATDQDATCNVYYADGAPIVPPAPVAPVIIIQQLPAPVSEPVAPSVAPITSGAVPDVSVPVFEPVATDTPGTADSNAAQITELQAQIIQLYKILIALLSQKLATLQ